MEIDIVNKRTDIIEHELRKVSATTWHESFNARTYNAKSQSREDLDILYIYPCKSYRGIENRHGDDSTSWDTDCGLKLWERGRDKTRWIGLDELQCWTRYQARQAAVNGLGDSLTGEDEHASPEFAGSDHHIQICTIHHDQEQDKAASWPAGDNKSASNFAISRVFRLSTMDASAFRLSSLLNCPCVAWPSPGVVYVRTIEADRNARA